MNAIILKSTRKLKLQDTHVMTGYNYALSHLQDWERDFGLRDNLKVPFGQTIRFVKSELLGSILSTLQKFEDEGYIKLDRAYAHIRIESMKNEEEWKAIDRRVKRMVRKGQIFLAPYEGHPYILHPRSPKFKAKKE